MSEDGYGGWIIVFSVCLLCAVGCISYGLYLFKTDVVPVEAALVQNSERDGLLRLDFSFRHPHTGQTITDDLVTRDLGRWSGVRVPSTHSMFFVPSDGDLHAERAMSSRTFMFLLMGCISLLLLVGILIWFSDFSFWRSWWLWT